MIGPMPKFLSGGHVKRGEIADGYEHDYLTSEATNAEKKEFESYYNTEYDVADYKEVRPDMKHPYLKWNGKFEDKG